MSSIGCQHCRVTRDAGGRAHHQPDCIEMFFGGDRSKPRGVPGDMPARATSIADAAASPRKQHAPNGVSIDELDRIRPGFGDHAEQVRLAERNGRAAGLRDTWWLIVKDAKEMSRTGHDRAVRWARAGLGFEDGR